MKWENMSVRDRIAARIYVGIIFTPAETIIWVPKVWAGADTVSKRKCRGVADQIIKDIEAARREGRTP